MDDFDRQAMTILESNKDMWDKDKLYPGSVCLTDNGIKERDKLASQLREEAKTYAAK
jgi:hypothetical protein